MQTKTIRGLISYADHKAKFDDDGIEYGQYTLYIDQQKLMADVPKSVYLLEGMEVLLEIKDDGSGEVLSGYCVKEGTKWGKGADDLKRQTGEFDHYVFVEGKVVEKRRGQFLNMRRNNRYRPFNIVLEHTNFTVTEYQAKPIKAGMEIAAVLQKNNALLIFNKTTGNYISFGKHHPLLLLVFIVAFNAGMLYTSQSEYRNKLNVEFIFWIVNGFLICFLLLALNTNRKNRKIKAFLDRKLNRF